MPQKEEEMDKIRQEVLSCQKCPLYQTRTNAVLGEGSLEAEIMFVGEGPGFNEDRLGRPFVGAAGKVLEVLLESIGLQREDVYITNIVKDRPTATGNENRAPRPEEIEACTPYLERQIEIIKPKIICTLGNYSTRFVFEKYGLGDKVEGISRIRGQVFSVDTLFSSLKIVPLYHPAVATYNPNMKQILIKDFKTLKELL